MTVYVHSTDGKTVDSGISIEPREGWTPCVYEPPKTEADEVCVCDGFVRDDEAFRAVFKVTKVEVEPMKYSTLSIKRELYKLGKWDAAKALLEASGYWDDYVLANDLAEQDEAFKAACAGMVAAGIVTQDELKELLPKCIWVAG